MRERDVVRYLCARIKALGGDWRRVEWLGRRGAPDLRVWLPKQRPVWVETKAPGGELGAHQAREHARMRRAGERVLVIWTTDGVDRHFPLP